MAWAEKIPSSGRWRGLYRDAAGRKRTAPDGPFTRRSEALRAAAAAEDTARRLPAHQVRTGKLTWGQWADIWWDKRPVEPSTLLRDRSRRECHIEPRWGNVRIDTITTEDVQDWVDGLAASGLSPSTVARIYTVFSSSMTAAVRAKRIAVSPCQHITLPRQPPADERYLTWDEVKAITHFMPEHYATLVWTMVGTGLRWGEAVGLHRHRLHLDAGRIDVHEVWDQTTREVKPYPKGRTKRSVPLPDWLVARLDDHIRTLPPATSCTERHRQRDQCRSGLVFPARNRGVLDYDHFRWKIWGRSVGRWVWCAAGEEEGPVFRTRGLARQYLGPDAKIERRWQPGLSGVEDVTVHDLRHTYASWLLQSGRVSIEQVSELLGHKSIATTHRYAHLADTHWAGVVAALEDQSAPHLPHSDHDHSGNDHNVARFRRSGWAF